MSHRKTINKSKQNVDNLYSMISKTHGEAPTNGGRPM